MIYTGLAEVDGSQACMSLSVLNSMCCLKSSSIQCMLLDAAVLHWVPCTTIKPSAEMSYWGSLARGGIP